MCDNCDPAELYVTSPDAIVETQHLVPSSFAKNIDGNAKADDSNDNDDRNEENTDLILILTIIVMMGKFGSLVSRKR